MPNFEKVSEHPFWDKQNIALHLMNALAQTADAYSTQRFLQRGTAREMNPLARPFVERGWPGQAAYSYGLGVGGTLGASYLLHRLGRHGFERLAPILVAAPTGVAAGLNFRF